MNDGLNAYLRMYRSTSYWCDQNPFDYLIAWERDLIFEKMMTVIPQSHYDEINFVVYGITRTRP